MAAQMPESGEEGRRILENQKGSTDARLDSQQKVERSGGTCECARGNGGKGDLENGLLVVGQLHHQGTVEDFLEPLREDKGDKVPEVHRLGAGPSSRVQINRTSLLESSQERSQVPV